MRNFIPIRCYVYPLLDLGEEVSSMGHPASSSAEGRTGFCLPVDAGEA